MNEAVLNRGIAAGIVPDALLRTGIRYLLRKRLRAEKARSAGRPAFLQSMAQSPLAAVPDAANRQHYEVPSEFFELVLGRNLKYSSALWDGAVKTLDDAEDKMLALYCERGELADGMQILELGCGWGSLSLWMARNYPHASVTAISNSKTQKSFIDKRARELGLSNLMVETADMNVFRTDARFDRVVSIEMFEHMRNWETLFEKIAAWLEERGKLFFHIFCHRDLAYFFEARSAADWMSRYFFSGGMMPSADLPLSFEGDLQLEKMWNVNGRNYGKTAAAWHENLLARKHEALRIFEQTYGPAERATQFARWKLFFLACEELFNFRSGNEWAVSHYLFRKRAK